MLNINFLKKLIIQFNSFDHSIFGFCNSSNTLILSEICLIFTIFNHLQNYFNQINKLKISIL